ncbi:MAG: hypothetical protein ABI165_06670 [Bryobacteraceae bacterium]
MQAKNLFATSTLLFTLAAWAAGAPPALVVDRGLPQANLNNDAGAIRSNVRWSWYDHGFVGDDFTIGAPGESWVIDGIRTWAVPGNPLADPQHLGDFYQDVRLYFGGSQDGLTPVASGLLDAGEDQTSNPNVQISQTGATPYDNFGANLKVWQIDFQHLNLAVAGGAKHRFGAWGMGRAIPGRDGKTYPWFNHASNASLSEAAEDGADGTLLMFDAAGRYEGSFNADGAGWDKPADINVQVFAHRAEPTAPKASTN